jgi:D-arabinose 5-phosphate isomerase GutQ
MDFIHLHELQEKAKTIIQNEARAVLEIQNQLDSTIQHVVQILYESRGHVLTTGAGTSKMIAMRFAHLLSCCGTPALFISADDSLHGGAGAVTPDDVIYVISKGGRSREINSFVDIAKKRGARIIAHTEDPHSPLAMVSDAVYCIKTMCEVDPYGMIATGSSLVNGAACDVLCVLLLELKGYTKEQFGMTHPEGAVGIQLAEK